MIDNIPSIGAAITLCHHVASIGSPNGITAQEINSRNMSIVVRGCMYYAAACGTISDSEWLFLLRTRRKFMPEEFIAYIIKNSETLKRDELFRIIPELIEYEYTIVVDIILSRYPRDVLYCYDMIKRQ